MHKEPEPRQGLANAVTVPRQGHHCPCSVSKQEQNSHKDKLQGRKGLLRNRDMTLGRFFTRQDEVLAFYPRTRIHCLLQRVLETRATFSSRDAHLARFPKHPPLPCQGIRKITPISLPCRAPTPKAAPALLQKIFLLLCREALSSSPELTGFPPCCAETNGY